MQFSVIRSLAALALASVAAADSDSFGLIVLRSGSEYQYSTIYVNNNEFSVSGSSAVEAVVTDDGKLKLSDGSYAVVSDDGISTGSDGSSPFSISNGYLQYDDSSAFYISDDLVKVSGSDESQVVSLSPRSTDGSAIADFTPSGSSSSSSGNSSNSTSSASSSSSAVIQTQTENGAAKYAVSLGAGIAAAAALVL